MESTKVEKMKKLPLLLILPLLVACGGSEKPKPVATLTSKTVVIKIPANCSESKVLTAVQKVIAGATFIDTKWTPAPNTELADVLDNGGLACSFGVASAEIGATVRWVNDSKMNYEKWSSSWVTSGYKEIDLANYGLTKGYILIKPQSDTQEFAIWNLNFKANGVWVSISKTSGDTLEAGKDLIEAVLAQ